MAVDPLRIEGLREFQAALKKLDGESQKQIRAVLNDAAQLVVTAAKPRVAVKTGAARGTLRAGSSQREARVTAGKAKVPYYGFLDFGGRVGVGKSVNRPFLKEGRYIYPGYESVRTKVAARMEKGLADLAAAAGLDMD